MSRWPTPTRRCEQPQTTSLIVFGALAASLTGCGPLNEFDNVSNEVTAERIEAPMVAIEDGRFSPAQSWTAYSTVDPLTDVEKAVANRTFRSGRYTIELEVSCDSRRLIAYVATTFDEEGNGAPLDWSFGSRGLEFAVHMRADQNDATTRLADPRRYSNQFTLSLMVKQMAEAMKLTMRFAMPNADATIFVDQSDAVFRDVVAPCLAPDPATVPPAATEPVEDENAYGPDVPLPDADSAFPDHEQRLIDQAREAWGRHRGSGGDQEKAYDDHSVLLAQLFGRGICWGRAGQSQVEYDYHRCGPESLQIQSSS